MSWLANGLIVAAVVFLLLFGEPITNRIRARKGQQ